MQHIHTLMTFRHCSCDDPWEKALEILIMFPRRCWPVGYFLPVSGSSPRYVAAGLAWMSSQCTIWLRGVRCPLGLKCAPKALRFLLFKACPIIALTLQGRPLLSARLSCSREILVEKHDQLRLGLQGMTSLWSLRTRALPEADK